MTRYIDADALIADCNLFNSWDGQIVKAWVDDQPTVDAVEVIRCKDCVWNREKEWVDCYMSGMHGRNVNNFCSRGERKEE